MDLFDPTKNHLVIGPDYVNKPTITNSFYYNNSVPKEALERFDSFETFNSSNLLEPAVNNKELLIIYADNDNFIKFFTSLLKTQVKNLTKEFFLDAAKLFAVRLNTRAKLIQSEEIRTNIKVLADMFMALEDIPNVDRLNLPELWVRYNAGLVWKLAVENYTTIDDVINRYVYSFYQEARAKYLSRKPAAYSWAIDPNARQYSSVVSMKDLYIEMRKEFNTFTDPTILKYYQLNDIKQMVKDPLFLLLLSANKNMGDKIDIWLLRWLLKMPKEQINQMGLIA
jgi:hypothetical protein